MKDDSSVTLSRRTLHTGSCISLIQLINHGNSNCILWSIIKRDLKEKSNWLFSKAKFFRGKGAFSCQLLHTTKRILTQLCKHLRKDATFCLITGYVNTAIYSSCTIKSASQIKVFIQLRFIFTCCFSGKICKHIHHGRHIVFPCICFLLLKRHIRYYFFL